MACKAQRFIWCNKKHVISHCVNFVKPMFAVTKSPLSIAPNELDTYLAAGWFRMNQTIFTTHFLLFNNVFYNAIWLRVNTAAYNPAGKHMAALKRISGFTTEVCQARITRQHEELYEQYKTTVAFDTYSSLYQLLFGGYVHNIYNTKQVNIYDGNTLIGTGFFDVGKTSAQGIICAYHPGYKKYSLGKCLMYNKLDYCRKQGLEYFYPGYAVPGYAAFDYKLTVGTANLEFYNVANNTWLPFTTEAAMYRPLDEMYNKLVQLKQALDTAGCKTQLLYYRFFDAALNISLWTNLLDYPVFILPAKHRTPGSQFEAIVFDVATAQYVIIECSPIYSINDENVVPHIFSTEVLLVNKKMYAAKHINDMVNAMAAYCNMFPGYKNIH